MDLQLLASPTMGNARLLSFHRLAGSGRVEVATGGEEHAMDILSGVCDVHIREAGGATHTFRAVGGRAGIFAGRPAFVYIPRGASYAVEVVSEPFEAGIFAVPTQQAGRASYIAPERVIVRQSGKLDWQRDVYIGLGEDGPTTMMLVGETDSPPGNWSSFPPHRHMAENPPAEHDYEELYYFKFQPAQGFAVGGVYHDPDDRPGTARLTMVQDSQTFDAPRGYHFISPCPAYRLRYIWALGGPAKKFGAWVTDPAHDWINRL